MSDIKRDVNVHEMSQLPIQAYLDAQVMPLLMEAFSELVKSKPQDPI